MTLAASVVWEVDAATGNNAYGGGFDPVSGTPGRDYTYGVYQATYDYTDIVIGTAGNEANGTSVGRPFVANDVGNILNVKSGVNFTVQRCQIMSVAGGVATFDKGLGTAEATGGTGTLGGALASLVSVESATGIIPVVAGNTVHVKKATYTASGAANYGGNDGTNVLPIKVIGYTTARNDATTGTNCPLINMGANSLSLGDYWISKNLSTTGTATSVIGLGLGNSITNCNHANTYTSARIALAAGNKVCIYDCSFTSKLGTGLDLTSADITDDIIGCTFIDCVVGVNFLTRATKSVSHCIFDSCITGITASTGGFHVIHNNTFRNCTTAFSASGASTGWRIFSNIISDCDTGASWATLYTDHVLVKNLWNNNRVADTVNMTVGATDTVDTDPVFTSVFRSGTTATAIVASPFTFTATGQLTGVVAGDSIVIRSGTHATDGVYIVQVSSAPDSVTLDRTCCTENADHGDIIWGCIVGGTSTNHGIGAAMKATGFPGAFPNTGTTSYLDPGAVQRLETVDELTRNTDPTEALVVTGTSYKIANVAKNGAYPTTATTNAAHLAADVITLNAHKDEMIAANTAIQGHYPGVDAGTAAGGGGVSISVGG